MVAPSYHSDLKLHGNFKMTGITSITGKMLPVILELGKHTMSSLIEAYISQKLYKFIHYGEAIDDPSQFLFRGFSPEDMKNPNVLDTAITSKIPLHLIHTSMAPKGRESLHCYGSDILVVKSLTGKIIDIKCDILTYTVAQLKVCIADSEGCPEDQQRLIYKGKQLEDNRLLNDYDIKNGDDIHLVLRLRGGMFSEVSGRDGAYLDNTPLVLMTPTWVPEAKHVNSAAIASAAIA
jgi:uncharacterized ubiquitin-like protein YukD